MAVGPARQSHDKGAEVDGDVKETKNCDTRCLLLLD